MAPPTRGRAPMVAAGVAAVASAAMVATATDDGIVLCPIRRCTGGYCPGCGGTRAVRQLLAGDPGGAWAHNPWIVLAAAQAMVLGMVLAVAGPDGWRRRARALLVPLSIVNAALATAIWVARLTAGTIPAPF
ncbi:MAG: DUF2752 domain-containing protein [Actinomycetota bacterium]